MDRSVKGRNLSLTPRQLIGFTDRCDIWRATITIDDTGRIIGKSYGAVPLYTSVPCHFEMRQSAGQPAIHGRNEAPNVFSRDLVHFDGDQDIASDDVAVNLTLDAAGYPSQNFGLFWIAQWQAKNYSNRGGRMARKRVWEGIVVYRPPQGMPETLELLRAQEG